MGIRPAGAQLYHADGETDRQTKLIIALSNSVKVPKKESSFTVFLQKLPFPKFGSFHPVNIKVIRISEILISLPTYHTSQCHNPKNRNTNLVYVQKCNICNMST
jgi:hypothetical protein